MRSRRFRLPSESPPAAASHSPDRRGRRTTSEFVVVPTVHPVRSPVVGIVGHVVAVLRNRSSVEGHDQVAGERVVTDVIVVILDRAVVIGVADVPGPGRSPAGRQGASQVVLAQLMADFVGEPGDATQGLILRNPATHQLQVQNGAGCTGRDAQPRGVANRRGANIPVASALRGRRREIEIEPPVEHQLLEVVLLHEIVGVSAPRLGFRTATAEDPHEVIGR